MFRTSRNTYDVLRFAAKSHKTAKLASTKMAERFSESCSAKKSMVDWSTFERTAMGFVIRFRVPTTYINGWSWFARILGYHLTQNDVKRTDFVVDFIVDPAAAGSLPPGRSLTSGPVQVASGPLAENSLSLQGSALPPWSAAMPSLKILRVGGGGRGGVHFILKRGAVSSDLPGGSRWRVVAWYSERFVCQSLGFAFVHM